MSAAIARTANRTASRISLRVGLWVLYAAALLLAPLAFPSGLGLALASQVGIAIIACLSLNLLFGEGGMLSFGHAVIIGLAAYAAIHILGAVSAGFLRLPVSLVPLAGGVAGLIVAVLLGKVCTRRAGMSFAMITLGIGELVFQLASMMTGFFGGEGGVAGNRVVEPAVLSVSFGPQRELYYLIATYTLLSTLALYGLTRTPFGRVLNAVRDNPERAGFVGLSARRIRLRCFVIAGFFAGIAGGLYALNLEIVTPDVLDPAKSASLLIFTLLGGSTLFVGPIVGAVLMVLCSALLPGVTKAWLLYVGLAFMAMMMTEPGGLAALVRRMWLAERRADIGFDRVSATRLGRTAARMLAGVSSFLAFATLVEMLYRVRLDAALGPMLPFLGLQLDTSSSSAWLVAFIVMAASVAAWFLLRRAATRRFSGPARAGAKP